jgi:type I restriction-modification system DNA methylase subunit
MSEIKTEYEGDKQKELGAFYTPETLVKHMYSKVDILHKTVLDNSCGYGNILMEGFKLKLSLGETPVEALSELYGVELDPDVHKQCKLNLCQLAIQHGMSESDAYKILNKNIVCHDALTYDYSFGGKPEDTKGKSKSGNAFRFGGIK